MTVPLDVLLATPDFPPAPGGIQLLAHRLATHLPDCRVRVVTLPDGRSGRLHNAALNADVIREGLRRTPDVVLAAHIVASPAALALSRLRGVPYVQYLHAREVPNRPRLARRAVAGAAAVVAVSRYTRDLALDVGADPGQVRIVPPGVDLPADPRRAPDARPTIVSVARMDDAYKGQDVLLEALPLIAERVPDVHLVLIGDCRLLARLEERAAGLPVTFTGAVDDAERDAWLGRAHVFAMPSREPEGGAGEGFGIVFLEAAARGLPAVGCSVGGALDAVADGETGLLVDPGDPRAVAAALTSLLLDRALAERLGRAGAERARDYAWPAIAGRVADVLREAAALRPAVVAR